MQPTAKPQSPFRGSSSIRGRGRGRGSFSTPSSPAAFSNGATPRGGTHPRASRGRGAPRARASTAGGSFSKRFNSPPVSTHQLPHLPIDIAPESIKPHNPEKIAARREKLREQYEAYKANAIENGLMSSDKQSNIDAAIKTRGTCTQMCDEKERVERIFNGSVAPEEMLPSPETGNLVCIEGRMVKAFRRAAAGVNNQIPAELRTPKTLKRVLDYLFKNILGESEHYGQHYKFIWDRTRAVRNDFSIQSFTKPDDVKYEVDCYERIIRYHILTLHQMSNPDQLSSNEAFARQQEMEQLQKAFASLMDKYDSFGRTMNFKNEPEFRAYFILFSPNIQAFDLDVQISRWSKNVLNDGRVQTALKIQAAAGNIDFRTGNFHPIPPSIAQSNIGLYWTLMRSQQVGYLMACVAEISFQLVRFTALNTLWKTMKGAPAKAQVASRTWTREALTEYLGFDDEDQVNDFCGEFGLSFSSSATRAEYLDFQSNSDRALESPSWRPFDSSFQVFSETIVEEKRGGRTFTAIINGVSIAAAERMGMVIEDGSPESKPVRNSMFVQDDEDEDEDEEEPEEKTKSEPVLKAALSSPFNAQAATFTPGAGFLSKPAEQHPSWMTKFGEEKGQSPPPAGGAPKGPFTLTQTVQEQSAQVSAPKQSPFSSTTSDKPQSPFNKPPPASQPTAGSTTGSSVLQSPQSAPPAFPTFKFAQSPTPTPDPKPAVTEPVFKPFASQPTTPQFSFDKSVNTKSTERTPTQAAFPGESKSAPVFEFLQPKSTVAATPTPQPSTFLSSSTFKFDSPSAPEKSTKQPDPTPSFKPFNFQQVFAQNPPAPTPIAAAAEPTIPQKQAIVAEASFPQSSLRSLAGESATFTSTHGAPLLSPTQPRIDISPATTPSATEVERQPIDEAALVEQLCRIGLVQQNGILDMFISFEISKLVQDVYRGFQERRFARQTSSIKKKILRRKYFVLWKNAIDRKRLRKRAEKRRKMFVTSVRSKEENRREKEEELTQILEAEKEKKRMQEEQQQKKTEVRKQKLEQNAADGTTPMPPPTTIPAQRLGQKRKTLANSMSSTNIHGIAMSSMHKRSRTLGSSTDRPSVNKTSPPTSRSPRASLTGSSDLRRSLSQTSMRQSLTEQRLDQTRTDYFRLKAMGVDPETPFAPDTATSLAAKRRKEEEDRNEASRRITARVSSSLYRSRTSTPSDSQSDKPAVTLTSASVTKQPAIPRSVPVTTTTDEDPFLKSLREARKAMSQEQDWLKHQAAEIEKEIEQQETFRRSIESVSSRADSIAPSSNGFTRSTSGYEYVPPDLQPGQSLSRTEQRIRRTGAHGLANKPIGGTPISSPSASYTAVPMSRRSASALQEHHDVYKKSNGDRHSRKRSFDEVADVVEPTNLDGLAHHAYIQLAEQTPKKAKLPSRSNHQQPVHPAAYPYQDEDEDEEDEEEEEEEDEQEEGTEMPVHHRNDPRNPFADHSHFNGIRNDQQLYPSYPGQASASLGMDNDEAEEEEGSSDEDGYDEEYEDENHNFYSTEQNFQHPGQGDTYSQDARPEFVGDSEEPYDDEDDGEGEDDSDADEDGYLNVQQNYNRGLRGISTGTQNTDTDGGKGSTVEEAIELSD